MQQPVLRAHPERTAWVVVWGAFALLCVLAVAVPLGARYVLRYSTVARSASLQVLEGTVRVINPSSGGLDAVTKERGEVPVGEGFAISLDDKASADLRFFDGSLVHILPGSDLVVDRLREARYASGVTPDTIWLRMVKGGLRLVAAKSTRPAGLDFSLRLQELGAEMALKADGVYGATVDPAGGEFWTHLGKAVVTCGGQPVTLLALERTTVKPGSPPLPPIASAKDLITNGDFGRSLLGWAYYNDQGADGPSVDGTLTLTTDGDAHAARFFRLGSNGNHCETILQQDINKPLPDPSSSLVVRASVKVSYQSLPGGGTLASEFPLMIRLRYRDEYGHENEWVQGFYYGDPQGYPTLNGIQVPQGGWYLFESPNLLETLNPKPAEILGIKVYASGWDYDSMLGSVSLEVQ